MFELISGIWVQLFPLSNVNPDYEIMTKPAYLKTVKASTNI